MAQNTSRRLMASVLLGTMTTALAACGIASGPVMPRASTPNAAALARKTQDVPRTFGTVFTPNTPRVKFVNGGLASNLPATADLRSKLSPVDDQGRIGSCTAFAVVSLAEFRARARGNTEELSPGFIFLMNLHADGNLGRATGASISTGVQNLAQYGTCPESLHPYLSPTEQTNQESITAYVSELPSQTAMKAAVPHRIPGAKPVGDIVALKTAVAAGTPVIFGIDVYKGFMGATPKTTGVIPLPDGGEERLGGHAIVAVGYDDAKRQITFRNSWGPGWGDGGYGYLPYDYFRSGLARDAWAVAK
jgi:C1A family cysteine protease